MLLAKQPRAAPKQSPPSVATKLESLCRRRERRPGPHRRHWPRRALVEATSAERRPAAASAVGIDVARGARGRQTRRATPTCCHTRVSSCGGTPFVATPSPRAARERRNLRPRRPDGRLRGAPTRATLRPASTSPTRRNEDPSGSTCASAPRWSRRHLTRSTWARYGRTCARRSARTPY